MTDEIHDICLDSYVDSHDILYTIFVGRTLGSRIGDCVSGCEVR